LRRSRSFKDILGHLGRYQSKAGIATSY